MKSNTYYNIEQRIIKNRITIRATKDAEEKRRLIEENHQLMTKLDNNWNSLNK